MSSTDTSKVERHERRVEVCFSPKQFELYKDEFHTCVVIDVLRATSAICAGLANGVDRIIPVPTVEEARALQAEGCIAAAERNGQIVEGFDFGNSPRSYLTDELVGKTVALTTTNGTKAIAMAQDMPQVAIGSINNLDAISTWLMQQPGHVVLLCSGWKDKFNLEDTICAGAIADRLIDIARYKSIEDSTIAAKHLFLGVRGNIFSFLKASSHRRRLRNLNLGEDIKYCLTPNTVNVVPVLHEGALVDSRTLKVAEAEGCPVSYSSLFSFFFPCAVVHGDSPCTVISMGLQWMPWRSPSAVGLVPTGLGCPSIRSMRTSGSGWWSGRPHDIMWTWMLLHLTALNHWGALLGSARRSRRVEMIHCGPTVCCLGTSNGRIRGWWRRWMPGIGKPSCGRQWTWVIMWPMPMCPCTRR